MNQKTYDKEFKLNAVKLYLANKDTKSIKAIAEDLGVSRPSLGHWIRNYKAQGDKGFVGSGHRNYCLNFCLARYIHSFSCFIPRISILFTAK